MKKQLLAGLFCASFVLAACGTGKPSAPAKTSEQPVASAESSDHQLKIVSTIFPCYDFAKEIVKDDADVKMLLKPGAESHSYEPTPQDIKEIQDADLFIYVGGENDVWVEKILSSMKDSHLKTFKLVDAVTTLEEEHVEGMQAEEEDHEEGEGEECEMDEHVWTSPKQAQLIVSKLAETIESLDPSHKEVFQKNTDEYLTQLKDLDAQFQDVVDHAKRKTFVFGDRFPLRYFANDYGLKYYAAFPGCSTDTEVNANTLSFLIDKVKEEKIPVVFTIELSNGKIADSICEVTHAKKLQFNSCHNVTKEQFENHETYLSLMKANVPVLKEALD